MVALHTMHVALLVYGAEQSNMEAYISLPWTTGGEATQRRSLVIGSHTMNFRHLWLKIRTGP